jgi:hypothetical protein
MSLYLTVRPSAHMDQFGSHSKDFREIWYLIIFRKSVEKIQASDENEIYLA